MKKILLGAAALSVMFATSCKKNDDKGGPSSTFTLNGTSYTPSTVMKQSVSGMTAIMGTDNTNTFEVIFNTTPTASGTYKISETASAADEITVAAANGSSTTYTGLDNSATATVTVNSGKISVVVPQISAIRMNTSTMAMDTVKISGTLVEN